MKIFSVFAMTAAAAFISGCATNDMPLEKRYILDYSMRAYEDNGRTHLRISGKCGLPMGVTRYQRVIDKSVMHISMTADERYSAERTIDEQFIVPPGVDTVMMGDFTVWTRPVQKVKKTEPDWN